MSEQKIVSITSQGQLSIPKSFLRVLGIKHAAKALVWRSDDRIIVEPKKDFWQLAGSLSSRVKMTDAQLKKAR